MKKLNLMLLGTFATLGLALDAPSDFAPRSATVHTDASLLGARQGGITTTNEFLAAMRKHMEIGASEEITKLVRRHSEIAVWAMVALCKAYAAKPSERLIEEIDALRVAWNKAEKSSFADNIYEYYSLLDSATKNELAKATGDYINHENALAKARGEDDDKAILALAPKLLLDAQTLTKLGNDYYAGQAWYGYAFTQDEYFRGDDANLDEAARAYKEVVDSRVRLDLKDKAYAECKARLEQLEKLGASADPNAPGEKKSAITRVGEPIVIPLTFRAEADTTRFERPIWENDEAYTSWNSMYFPGADGTSRVSNMPLASAQRTGPSSFVVNSGAQSSEFKMNGKFMPCEVMLEGPNGNVYPWAFIGVTGISTDTFQGVEVNLEPSDTGLTVYIAPAGVLEGELNGETLQIFDDSMSGVWGDPPSSWSYIGMTEDNYQWDMDSVVIGKSKKALPWSQYQQVGGTWYELEIQGSTLTAYPVELPTGELKLSFKGAKPDFMVLRGQGPLSNTFVDLTASRSVEVPVGTYELLMGGLSEGKRSAIKKVIIVAGEETPVWRVPEGEEVEVQLGKPFKFDFIAEDLGDSVQIVGESIVVVGAGGERYERPWNNRPFPEASVRKVGSKRGGKPEDLFSQLDQDTLYANWNRGFFPASLELPKPKGAEEGVEVQLTEKKNDLFGKLESDWIAPQ